MACHSLTVYATELLGSALFKVDEAIFRKWEWIIIPKIGNLTIASLFLLEFHISILTVVIQKLSGI